MQRDLLVFIVTLCVLFLHKDEGCIIKLIMFFFSENLLLNQGYVKGSFAITLSCQHHALAEES
jgi:hypothetical protein